MINYYAKLNFKDNIYMLNWGLGIGDWGLGIWEWGKSPIPNPQSPIPNPQSPLKKIKIIKIKNDKFINN